MNVINVYFSHEFKSDVYNTIKLLGVDRTIERMTSNGYNEAFVRVLVRHIQRRWGW
jgi:hypothetical protein